MASLVPAYTCKICRQTLTLKDPIIVGEKPEEKIGRTFQMLFDHIADKHKEAAAEITMIQMNFGPYVMLKRFDHNDKEIDAATETVRGILRRMTKRVNVPDDKILTQARKIVALPEFAGVSNMDAATEVIAQVMRGLRDRIEETAAAPAVTA